MLEKLELPHVRITSRSSFKEELKDGYKIDAAEINTIKIKNFMKFYGFYNESLDLMLSLIRYSPKFNTAYRNFYMK